jgi:succinate dehydrogenase/fumarate reductase flavoprotein subunit
MQTGLSTLQSLRASWKTADQPTTAQLEAANMCLVAELILTSGILRKESRGAHYREDFPQKSDGLSGVHTWVSRDSPASMAMLPPNRSIL